MITKETLYRKIIDACLDGNYRSDDLLATGHLWSMVYDFKYENDKDFHEVFESTIDTIAQDYPELFELQYRFYPDIEDNEAIVINNSEVIYYRHDRLLIDVVTGEQLCSPSSEIYRDLILI